MILTPIINSNQNKPLVILNRVWYVNYKLVLCLYIYSEKLGNQQVVSNSLYLHCTVVHQEEGMFSEMALFLR